VELYASTVWANGGFRSYADARVGLMTHGLQYGTGCFEGIRGFWNAEERELYLLHLREHFERMRLSTNVLMMKLPHDTDELVRLTIELCARNGFEENVYIRPVAYKAGEDVGVRLAGVPDAFAIVAVPYRRYYEIDDGIKACVSSWRRTDDTSIPARAKITGNYVNSALAKSEAQLNGFDEAIMLSHDGHVSEGSADNLFLVRDKMLHTPDASQNVLEGITRNTIATIARAEGLEVRERTIDRSELYGADEVFVTGTAAGVIGIASIDHRTVGAGGVGPVTRKLGEIYNEACFGRVPSYKKWLTPTYADRRVGAA